MSTDLNKPRFTFTFNYRNYQKHSNKIPPVTFTCQALASGSLAPHLKLCSKFLSYLQNRKDTIPFQDPVRDDPINIPDYFKIIKHPMDFSTVGRKIFDEEYPNLESFKSDIDLIWQNCITYNSTNSSLGRLALRLKSIFDEKWNIHISLGEEAEMAIECIETMSEAMQISNEEFNPANPLMQIFRMPPYMKMKVVQMDRTPKPQRHEKEKEDHNSYLPPSQSLLNTPMTTKDKYELAVSIDTLPPELLGEVIEILAKTLDLKKDQEIDVPFSMLDNATLRTIEAYVKYAKDKEPSVRRMYQNETIPAEKQLEILKEEMKRVIELLEHKKALRSSSGLTSETSGEISETEGSDSTSDVSTSGSESGDEE